MRAQGVQVHKGGLVPLHPFTCLLSYPCAQWATWCNFHCLILPFFHLSTKSECPHHEGMRAKGWEGKITRGHEGLHPFTCLPYCPHALVPNEPPCKTFTAWYCPFTLASSCPSSLSVPTMRVWGVQGYVKLGFWVPTTSQCKKVKQVQLQHAVLRCSHHLQIDSPPHLHSQKGKKHS